MAEGGRRQISHVTESAWGTASGTAFTKDRVTGGAGITVPATNIQSQEMRGDRGMAKGRLGSRKPVVSIPGELSYGTFDDYLASAMRNAWAAAKTPITGLSTTVVAGTTNTMAATGIGGTGGSLVAVGDWVKVSGFTAGAVGNNGYWKVTARGADLLTLGEAKNADGSSKLTAVSGAAAISVTAMGSLVSGVTEKSLQIEEAQLDISVFKLLVGAVVNSMSINVAPDSIIGVNFDMLGKSMATPAAVQYAVSYTGPTTVLPMMSNDTVSILRVDGTPVAVVTALTLNLANGAEAKFPVFQADPNRIAVGRSNLSGSMSLYFLDATYWTKYLAETRVALSIMFMTPDGTTGYAVDIPSVMLGNINPNVSENDIVHEIPWQAEYDATTTYLNWKWSKLA